MSEEKAPYNVDEANAVINADKQARAEECGRRLEELLGELRCELVAFVIIGGQSVLVPVQVIAR